MTYVALLRGINVGGNRKVEMAKLSLTFGRLGFTNIKTFIASGNVIFCTPTKNTLEMTKQIEEAIEQDFGFKVNVLIRDLPRITKLVKDLPNDWVNDKLMKCDVMFLWEEIDSPKILEQIPHNPEIEDVRYFPGAVVWRIDRDKVSKGKVPKIIGSAVYKQITVRNLNTVRKLHELMLKAYNA